MSTLYEELGVSTDATPEQIRKAYKKRALQTHPDRLPNATAAEKAASEEKFRKVNNAYEVLSDPKKRSEYDIHGVWPPPEVEPEPSPYMPSGSRHSSSYRRHSSRTQPFPDPFFAHHHAHHRHHAYSSFQFTDPFTLFDSIFEDLNPFRGHSTRQAPSPFSMDPFERMNRFHAEIDALMHDIDHDPFGMSGFPSFGRHPTLHSFPAIDRSPFDTNHGHWVSESFMTSTVNGVTQTISKRIDSEGNEHITRTLPDGRKIQTINGVEQGTAGQLPYNDYGDTSKARPLPEPSGHRYLPPVATRSQTVLETPSPREYASSPPPYTSQPTAYQPQPQSSIRPPDEHRRSRRSSEKYYANHHHSSSSNHSFQHIPTTPTEPHRKKRWWQ